MSYDPKLSGEIQQAFTVSDLGPPLRDKLWTTFGSPLTVVSEACSRDDRHSHHDQAAAAPHVLHEELLDHDVPETLGQDQVHLVRQGPVTLLQLTHLHLQQTVRYSEQLTTSMGGVTNCTLHSHNTDDIQFMHFL